MPDPIECVVRSCADAARCRNRQPGATEAVSTRGRYLLGGAAEQYELLHVASVQRQFHDAGSFHDLTHADAARFDQTRVGLHFNGLGHLAHLERDVDRRIAVHLQNNSCLRKSAESRQGRFQLVGTQ